MAIVVTPLVEGTPGKSRRFAGDCVKLGRMPTNDVVLDDRGEGSISRHHAAVFLDEGDLFVRDLGSRRGTFLNGERLTEPVSLDPADIVSLGERGPAFRFELVRGAEVPAAFSPPSRPDPPKPGSATRVTNDQDSVSRTIAAAKARKRPVGNSTLLKALDQLVDRERNRTLLLTRAVVGAAAVAFASVLLAVALYLREAGAVRDNRQETAGLKEALDAERQEHERRLAQLKAELAERDRRLAEVERQQDLSDGQRASAMRTLHREIEGLKQRAEQERVLAGTSWADLAERYKESLFLCVAVHPTRKVMGIGTAFAVGEGGVLATNAHVARMLLATDKVVVVQNSTSRGFELSAVEVHPDYTSARSPDVALLKLRGEGVKFHALPLASDEELRDLKVGAELGTLGYPGELAESYFANVSKERGFSGVLATFKTGFVGRITDYADKVAPFETSLWIQHSASLSGGTSGSPMFRKDGKVVAINNSGLETEIEQGDGATRSVVRIKDASQIGFAIRVDELRRLREKVGW